MIDVLEVLQLFEAIDEAHDLLGVRHGHLGRRGRNHGELGALHLNALLLDSLLNGHEVGRRGVDNPLLVSILVVVSASLGDGHHELVLVSGSTVRADGVLLVASLNFLGDHDLALALELERHGTGSAERAARMGERAAHVSRGAVAVVGQSLAKDSDASRAVAFILNGFVVRGVLAGTESLVNSGLDLVLRQGVALRLFDSSGERRVVFGVRVATFLRSNSDVTGKLGEQSRALSVLGSLAMLRCSPF